MNCKRKQQLLVDYLEGILSERKKGQMERHLSRCRNCSEQLAQLKRLHEQVQKLEVTQPSEQDWQRFQQNLMGKIQADDKSHTRQKVAKPVMVLRFALTTAFAVIFFFSLYMFFGQFLHRPATEVNLVENPDKEKQPAATMGNEFSLLAGLSEKEIEQLVDDVVLAEEERENADSLADVLASSSGYYDDLDELTPEECDEVLKQLDSI